MLDVLIRCGEAASFALLSYGAYLVFRHFDIVRGRVAARLANDDIRFLRAPALQEPATAGARPPSHARAFPGAAGDESAVAGAFLSREPDDAGPAPATF
jgi:hypothetical protein